MSHRPATRMQRLSGIASNASVVVEWACFRDLGINIGTFCLSRNGLNLDYRLNCRGEHERVTREFS